MANAGYYTWDQRYILEVGPGCRSYAPMRMEMMGCTRLAFITDEGVTKAGVAALVKDVFDAQGSPKIVGVYDKVLMDASGSVVNDCARWCKELAIDGIVAVGGGSVLDAAKTVRCMLGMNITNIWDIMPLLGAVITGPAAKPFGYPIVAFPTTAGTGAESSVGAVIYNEEAHTKGILFHDYLAADYAFLDPDLTIGLPPQLTAYTGFDALCHAVEGLTSPASHDISDAYSMQAIKMIVKYLPIAVQDGQNVEARTKMLVASNVACLVIAKTGGFMPIHNLDHALGAFLRISHGECNTVLLPCALEQFPDYYLPTADKLAEAFGVKKEGQTNEEMLNAAIDKIRELQKDCSVNAKFAPKMDDDLLNKLIIAVKSDPAGASYTMPENAVIAVLEAAFNR